VGNIVTGDDQQTQLIINLNALPALLWLLDNQKKNIRKESCWTISNVTAGTAEQIQAVINCGVFPKLIELLKCSEFDIQKEAAWAVSNATSGGTAEQILYLASQGAINPLCQLLSVADAKVITVALEGLENILRTASAAGDVIFQRTISNVSECGGLNLIEELQNHDNQAIYQRSLKILETYFGAEEVAESELAPQVAEGGAQYQFGGGAPQGPPGGYTFG
jgi:importin subunit alpha-2